jgi:hypothetical protein
MRARCLSDSNGIDDLMADSAISVTWSRREPSDIDQARKACDNHRNQTIPKRVASGRERRCAAGALGATQAISYANGGAYFRSGKIPILDSRGCVERLV